MLFKRVLVYFWSLCMKKSSFYLPPLRIREQNTWLIPSKRKKSLFEGFSLFLYIGKRRYGVFFLLRPQFLHSTFCWVTSNLLPSGMTHVRVLYIKMVLYYIIYCTFLTLSSFLGESDTPIFTFPHTKIVDWSAFCAATNSYNIETVVAFAN